MVNDEEVGNGTQGEVGGISRELPRHHGERTARHEMGGGHHVREGAR